MASGTSSSKEQVVRHIVLAVDESADSEYAVDWCIANMHKQGDYVHLLHCVPYSGTKVPIAAPMGHLHYAPLPTLESDEKIVATANQSVTRLFGSKLDAASIPFDVKVMGEDGVVLGGGVRPIGNKICSAARELDAAAVVVAAHRKSPFAEFMMGSVSNYLVHNCTRPVLVLHAPRSAESDGHLEATATRNIAVAVDLTEHADKVCSWALQHLVRPRDALHALHVVPAQLEEVGAYSVFGDVDGVTAYMPGPSAEQMAVVATHRAKVLADLESRLEDLVTHSEASDLMIHVVPAGVSKPMESVGSAICKKCESLNAAALVTLSGHKHPLTELFMGSVTSYCTHHCESPVIVLT